MLNFVCIGAQKSGTTWLYEALRKHPLIDFPGGKEVHFWDHYPGKDLQRYLGLFGNDDRCNGDITPAYAILPLDTIRKVRTSCPSLKIIYLMRNPIERAWSAALMALRRAEMTYGEASEQWFVDHFNSQGSLARGDHAACLRNWLSVFPREHVLIARYEEIIGQPVTLLNRVLNHVGLEEFFTAESRSELSRPVFEGEKRTIPPKLLGVLKSLYREKVDALSTLLDHDFSEWKEIKKMSTGVEPKKGNVVLVLGMHRSGTSAVAAGLENLGVFMGSTLAHADEWNPKGYFEERKIVAFNDQLLQLADRRWDSPLPPDPVPSPSWPRQLAPAASLLEEIFGDAATWGFKDPRMCLLSSFWQQVFASMGIVPHLLFVLRHPAEVAHSLARRDGISAKRAAWLWLTHLLGSLDYVQDSSHCHMVDFSALMSRPAPMLKSLCEWLGLSCKQETIEQYASEFISPTLAHGADAGSTEIPALVLRAYQYWKHVADQNTFSSASLHAQEWINIRDEFERDVKPGLVAVHDFFEGDRQLEVADARARTLSQALALAERLALERLEQLATLDTQLKKTTEGLAFVEKLALDRLEQLDRLGEQLKQVTESRNPVARMVFKRSGKN
ncbi:sulfotransferase [Achromobacter aloeverae]|uniref:Sulfotransferase domain-containing protein n=1 Tax=Achromobacter aloeverae TaxID=1750518 RepID=A0A4Q1HHH9_9BURK|nr:sulfotransferase [Achromobacter aloeverae]RXN86795.1 hypothetical protein C7R54_17900 [Achromobacter aloeverae]